MNIDEVADRIPARAAQVSLARTFALLGSASEWNSDTFSELTDLLAGVHPQGCPSAFDADDAGMAFWNQVRSS